ncbi:glycosyltransferase [Rugosimonospora acidiphila]|uniref:Glycosyltransferase n=1 Tax=Rugosimonospora acidiphila TaxID=556531 RepID=A0ABP9SCC3_9ACTN
MAKVVIASTPAQGHVAPLLTVATDLVRRGHEVVVHTGSRFGQRAQETGARFVPLRGLADFDERTFPGSLPGREEVPEGPERIGFDLVHGVINPMADQYEGLRALLADFPASVVLVDIMFLGILPISGLPREERPTTATVGILPPVFDSVDTAPFGTGIPPLPGEAGRARNRAMYEQMRQLTAPLQEYAAKGLADLGVQLDDSLFNFIAHAQDHYLQLTVPSFEYPRGDWPEGFRFVGALPPDPGGDFELPDWWGELTAGRPVVTVTQGTLENNDLSALVEPTLRALAELDVTVVAATARPDGPDAVRASLGTVPANARLAGFVPFDRLLPLSDVLITNGGYGGVHAALHHGVPLVVAGESQDKPEVAARVEWSGAGVSLHSGRPGEAAIRAAVTSLLAEPTFRTRARELRAEFAGYDPLETIAQVVETA